MPSSLKMALTLAALAALSAWAAARSPLPPIATSVPLPPQAAANLPARASLCPALTLPDDGVCVPLPEAPLPAP